MAAKSDMSSEMLPQLNQLKRSKVSSKSGSHRSLKSDSHRSLSSVLSREVRRAMLDKKIELLKEQQALEEEELKLKQKRQLFAIKNERAELDAELCLSDEGSDEDSDGAREYNPDAVKQWVSEATKTAATQNRAEEAKVAASSPNLTLQAAEVLCEMNVPRVNTADCKVSTPKCQSQPSLVSMIDNPNSRGYNNGMPAIAQMYLNPEAPSYPLMHRDYVPTSNYVQRPMSFRESTYGEPHADRQDGLLDLIVRSQQQHQAMLEMLQLPKTELTVFDGDPIHYWTFVKLFEEVVHKDTVDDAARLARLLQYCSDKVKKVLQGCAIMPAHEGYKKARQILKDRFGSDAAIAEAWITKLTDRAAMKNDDRESLQEFSDDLQQCIIILKAINMITEIDNQKAIVKMVERLPSYLHTRWRREVSEIKTRFGRLPNLGNFSHFVTVTANEANDPVYGRFSGAFHSSDSIDRPKQHLLSQQPVEKKMQKERAFYAASTASNTEVRQTVRRCVICSSEDHHASDCAQFKSYTQADRYKLTRDKGLCHNCLVPKHMARDCGKRPQCNCGKKHHQLLHMDFVDKEAGAPSSTVVPSSVQNGFIERETCNERESNKILLPVVSVRVYSPDGKRFIDSYALIDSGSTGTFCTRGLIERLKLKGIIEKLSLTTLGDTKNVTEAVTVSLKISDVNGHSVIDLPVVYGRDSLPVSEDVIAAPVDVKRWSHLRDLHVPQATEREVTLLIGQNVPEALIPIEVRRGSTKGAPYAMRTELGWSICGPVSKRSGLNDVTAHFIQHDEVRLEAAVERFWNVDDPSAFDDTSKSMSREDVSVLDMWRSSMSHSGGHFVMPIPFKDKTRELPDGLLVAKKRLYLLGKRLDKNEDLARQYTSAINDLLIKGYAEEAVEDGSLDRRWYLPHHAVINNNKDKIRVVFDCAARTDGLSLNDQVYSGPNLTNNLVGVLLRFRQYPVAIAADVEAMFHQVVVTEADRDALRFLWWPDGDRRQQPRTYRMTVHLFGGTWSPCAANFALQQTAREFGNEHSQEACDTVFKNFYVDDLLKSLKTRDSASNIVNDLTQLLAKGGFTLRKWFSNDSEVLSCIPCDKKSTRAKLFDDKASQLVMERTLGVFWEIEHDTFRFAVKSYEGISSTRRGILSVVCSIFDPCGYLSPFILLAKKLVQDLTRQRLGWDDPVSATDEERWRCWLNSLRDVSKFVVERCIETESFGEIQTRQLIHFADASQCAYGAVSYMRLVNVHDEVRCVLLLSKSRLAPMKGQTIPRLELMAATLAVNQDRLLRRELDMPIDDSIFFTDSMIVLSYICNTTTRFSVFVTNRLNEVHAGSTPSQWHHVASQLNPADKVSRGMTADQLVNDQEWTRGPEFVWHHPLVLERCDDNLLHECASDMEEVQKRTDNFATVTSNHNQNVMDRLLTRFSSFYELKRAVAWIMRVRAELQRRVKKSGATVQQASEWTANITVDELKKAAQAILKYVQGSSLPPAVIYGRTKDMAKGLRSLCPFVGEDGLVHVGGRLRRSQLDECSRHPILLPKQHHVTDLIVREYHERSRHAGKEHTLAQIRTVYWIIGARHVVKRCARNCMLCRRRAAIPCQQKMADLPVSRVQSHEPPFTNSGVDVFGPYEVRIGRSDIKRYGCLFTCLASRAIHLEMLYSMDTSSFINALRRFISRRGKPKSMWSDNGTNFVGADGELRKSVADWNKGQIDDFLKQQDVQWVYNPPSAPHMGGVWERMIRSVKNVLKATMRRASRLTDEALVTIFCEVEAIVNSRPLTAVSDDVNDLEALTPNHLLLLREGSALPPGDFVDQDVYARKRWRQVQFLADEFWRRWVHEYLPTLHKRTKWLQESRNLKEGDLVLMIEDGLSRNEWPLARVIEAYKGDDGRTRSVKVKTATSTLLVRPVVKLCLLEGVVDE